MLTELGAPSWPMISRPWVLVTAAAGAELEDTAEFAQWPPAPQVAGAHAMSQCVAEW